MSEEQPPEDNDSGLPPYVPPASSGGLKPSLMDEIMNMTTATTDRMKEIEKAGADIEKKVTRVRRKSRDLEEQMFGMEIKDVDMLKAVFDELDVTKDGYIDRTELHTALTKANKKCTPERCEEIFKSLDSDGNNLLDFKEFQKAFLKADD